MRLHHILLDTMSREGNDEYVGSYKSGTKRFEVWLRVTGDGNGRITYLRAYGSGSATFRDVISQVIADLKKLGVIKISYGVAIDDKTGGASRQRLFDRYKDAI